MQVSNAYVEIVLAQDGRCEDFGACTINFQEECDAAALEVGYSGA